MVQRTFPAPEDDHDRKLLADITRVGWGVIGIDAEPDGPDYAFSVGLFHSFGHPEVILMGLRHPVSAALINDIGQDVQKGERFVTGRLYRGVADRYPLAFVEMSRDLYREYLGYAGWFYGGGAFPVLQCVWPDRASRFPWDADYDASFLPLQRLLGSPPHPPSEGAGR